MGFQLSVVVLSKLWPHASSSIIFGVSGTSAGAFQRYGMTTVPEIVDFMAECSEETGGGMAFVESGAYSAERAHEVWPSLFPTVQSAQAIVGDERALFNRTYGGRLGNRPGTDDGYNFRGRGAIQITGRDWYTEIARDTGLDLVDNPDLAALPENVIVTAASFWKLDKVSGLVGNLRAEVKRINGGYTNMAAREAWEAKCKEILTPEALAVPPGPSTQDVAQQSPSPPKPPPIIAPALKPGDPAEGLKVHPTLMAEIEAVLLKWF